MRQYNALQAIYMSFYSRQLYRDVAANWGAYSFLYLLFILALSWIVMTVQIQTGLNRIYTKASDEFVMQIPVMTIKNGKMSTPEARPYFVKDLKNHEDIAIIDTTGKYTNLETAKVDLLVTSKEVILKPKPNEIRIDQFPANLNMVIEPQVVNQYVKGYVDYAWVLLFPAFLLISFFYRVIQALIYSLFGKIFAKVKKIHLSYGKILQISLVSITPVLVIAPIFNFFGIVVVYSGLFYFLLGMIYLFFGINANKK